MREPEQHASNLSAFRVAFIVVSILLMAFIFSNSAATATESGGLSDRLVAFINERLGIPVTSFMVRKAAHFSEFAALGLSLCYAMACRYKLSSVLGILYAVSDELHQLFVPGRSCEVRDMLIDAAGIITGTVFSFLLLKIFKRDALGRKRKKQS